MSRFWSEHVAQLEPYVPGEQPTETQLIKLNTNEHAYGPAPSVLEAIQKAVNDDLRLYPQPGSDLLVKAIAHRHQLSKDQVFVGNSSDEVLAHLFNALFRRTGKALWLPDITYSFYRTYCRAYQIKSHYVPLNEQFKIEAKDYFQAQANDAVGIIFANPNAPTGHFLPLSQIELILKKNPDIPVVIDEAYIDFGGQSASQLLDKYANLVVVHTFSKGYALAGLRVGYALSSAEVVAGLQRIKDSFNSYPLDRLAQIGAKAAIKDTKYYQKVNQKIIDNRHRLSESLTSTGFKVLPSMANFVFVQPLTSNAFSVFKGLRHQGVLVRYFQQPKIDNFLRITVGTQAQCDALVNALRKIGVS